MSVYKGRCVLYHCIALYCIVMYCIVLYCILLYCHILFVDRTGVSRCYKQWILATIDRLFQTILVCIHSIWYCNCVVLYHIVLHCTVFYCIVMYCSSNKKSKCRLSLTIEFLISLQKRANGAPKEKNFLPKNAFKSFLIMF